MISGKNYDPFGLPEEILQDQSKPRQYQGYFLSLVKGSVIRESEMIVAATLVSVIFRDKFHFQS